MHLLQSRILTVLAIFLMICTNSAHAQKHAKQQWLSLFNGKDLTGWTPKIRNYPAGKNYGNTFRVEDKKLVVRYDEYETFDERYGHLFYEKPYNYYRILIEYRFVGDQVKGGPGWATRNSGVMLHGQTPQSMGIDQDFPVSIEVQFLGGNGTDKRSTCNLCTPGTNVEMNGKLFTPHCVNSNSETYHGDQWVTAEVLVLGDSLIRHYVNGQEVMAYQKPQVGGGNVNDQQTIFGKPGQMLTGGTISLQSESHPVEFRKVELLNLEGCMDPKASNYKSYYVKSKNENCRYGK
jgi:hypothetical protein